MPGLNHLVVTVFIPLIPLVENNCTDRMKYVPAHPTTKTVLWFLLLPLLLPPLSRASYSQLFTGNVTRFPPGSQSTININTTTNTKTVLTQEYSPKPKSQNPKLHPQKKHTGI